MGSKRFEVLHDWVRHGYNMHLTCENTRCDHFGVVDPHAAEMYFRLHRWPRAIEAGALRHFYCTSCGARAGRARATEQAVTVTDFFPADERGWKAMQRRFRG